MKNGLAIAAAILLFTASNVFAEGSVAITFLSNLSQDDSGPAVLALQKLLNSDSDTKIANAGVGSPGNESSYFGALTKAAVIKFQEKYKNDVLTPAGLLRGTGFVGAFTLKKLNELVKTNTSVAANQVKTNNSTVSSSRPYSPENNSITPQSAKNADNPPAVFSVSPDRVRRGDAVTITGANFTPTDNTIYIGDGPIKERFDGLPSYDGKTVTFIYKPPIIQTMSVKEIEALPSDLVNQIETPIKAAGLTLEQVLTAQNSIKDEASLRDILQKNGSSPDEIYHHFYIIAQNSKGTGMSNEALLYGLRNMPSENIAQKTPQPFLSKIGDYISGFLEKLIPTAYAQMGMNGGGYTSGIVMVCTCNGSLMTFQFSYTGGGTGLYVFPPGFKPSAGSGLVAGPWIGGYQIMAGSCSIYAGMFCIYIPGNSPQNPVGYAF